MRIIIKRKVFYLKCFWPILPRKSQWISTNIIVPRECYQRICLRRPQKPMREISAFPVTEKSDHFFHGHANPVLHLSMFFLFHPLLLPLADSDLIKSTIANLARCFTPHYIEARVNRMKSAAYEGYQDGTKCLEISREISGLSLSPHSPHPTVLSHASI